MRILAQTDPSGYYRIEDVPPGRYIIAAGSVERPTFYPGTSNGSKARAVTVSAAMPVKDINFQVAGFTIAGKLIGPRFTDGQKVVLLGANNKTFPTANVNSDGSFRFEGIWPGSYQLYMGESATPLPVTIIDHDISGIEVVVPATVTLSGVLVVDGGGLRPRTIGSFTPYTEGLSALPFAVVTDAHFSIDLPEGEYRVLVEQLPAGYSVKSIQWGSIDLLASPLKAVAPIPDKPIVITLGVASPPPWVKVSGRVHGVNDQPAPVNSTVMLIPAPRGAAGASGTSLANLLLDYEVLVAKVKEDGTFQLPRVPAGSYTVRINTIRAPSTSSLVVANSDLMEVDVLIDDGRVEVRSPR
jgi:hypothetical protein